jgi:hypothetical protein
MDNPLQIDYDMYSPYHVIFRALILAPHKLKLLQVCSNVNNQLNVAIQYDENATQPFIMGYANNNMVDIFDNLVSKNRLAANSNYIMVQIMNLDQTHDSGVVNHDSDTVVIEQKKKRSRKSVKKEED